eukprot:1843348-Amphidinium_carterae.1
MRFLDMVPKPRRGLLWISFVMKCRLVPVAWSAVEQDVMCRRCQNELPSHCCALLTTLNGPGAICARGYLKIKEP